MKRWYPSENIVKNLYDEQIKVSPTCFLKVYHAHLAELYYI